MNIYKNEMVKRINELFRNREELISFCNYLSNDIDEIIKMINKIIKYIISLNEPLSIFVTLNNLARDIKSEKLKGIEENYENYLNSKNRKIFSKFKRKKDVKYCIDIPLDENISKDDLDGIRIPSLDLLKEICRANLYKEKRYLDRKKEHEEKQIFPEIGFTYARSELFTLNNTMYYYHPELFGNILEDFKYLYNIERYKNKEITPLNNSLSENLENIKKRNDIAIKILGDSLEIINGRHRIIYLFKNISKITIPISFVERRFEDREINLILLELKNKYNVQIYKNNLLNDDVNLLLVIDNKIYVVNNKEELKYFYNNTKNSISNNKFLITSFDKNAFNNDEQNKYIKFLYEQFKENLDLILTNNFTEILDIFPNENHLMLYFAFNSLQSYYNTAKVFGYDLNLFLETKLINFEDKIKKENNIKL